jgi:predicted methyltransferase MtxX (methanogen marker protein 4)
MGKRVDVELRVAAFSAGRDGRAGVRPVRTVMVSDGEDLRGRENGGGMSLDHAAVAMAGEAHRR